MTQPINDPTLPPAPATDTDATKLQADVDKWKALARKHEDQNKQARTELDALKAAGDATKSDMDKILARLEASDKRAEEAERKAVLGEVVAATGLSMAKVARLQGTTTDELLADAGEVFDWKPKAEGEGDKNGQQGPPANQPPTGRPRENLTPDPSGPAGGPPAEETNPLKLAEKIPRL